ncbi:MAG: MFS transporter [Rhodospirillales bacterium 20-64-7]|nr:MAG: MFS transporter [Rhodospirillales bacterium 20-64-7]
MRAASSTAPSRRPIISTIRAISRTTKNLGLITALGFSSGLPLVLCGFTLRMWLTAEHLPLGLIGLTASLGLPYTLKFLWAPIFDEVRPPLLGRRRGWLICVQAALIAAIAVLACSNPAHRIGFTLAMGGLVAFLSASQDILIDAWRIESFAPDAQGAALGGYVWGYRIAMLASGSGVIALSILTGWRGAYLLMAALALVGPAATLLAAEPPAVPASGGQAFAARFATAVWAPLAEFLSRRGALVIVAFIISYRLGEALAGVMLAPYYTFLGFNRAQIALANGPSALAATLAGAAFGGYVVAKLGVGRALIVATIFQTVVLLLYPALSLARGHPLMLALLVPVEAFAETFEYAAFLTYLSGLCDPRFTATQYALLSSLSPIALHTIGGVSGYIAQAMGFLPFFILCTGAALPAMALMFWILRFYPPADRRAGVG